jgi:hypothetical protein
MPIREYVVCVDGAPFLVIRSTPQHKNVVAQRAAKAYGTPDTPQDSITVKPNRQCTPKEYAAAMQEEDS